jgi:hypothetical protein
VADLNELKPSITQLSRAEAFQVILNVRANRRIDKREIKLAFKTRKTKLKSTKNVLSKLTPEQLAELKLSLKDSK